MGESTMVRMPSGKTERCAKPGNCRRHDPYLKNVTAGVDALMRDAQPTRPSPMHLREGLTFPPVVVPLNTLTNPTGTISRYALEYEYDLDRFDNSWNVSDESSFEDMNRNNMITGLRVTEVNLEGALANLFDARREDIPKNLYAYAESIGVAEPDNWDIDIVDGFYGEELADAHLNRKLVQDLQNWYLRQPNARDADGILAYCRSKGLVTTGLTPLNAIKAQLAQENPGISHQLVDNASQVRVEQLRHAQVHLGRQDRLAAVAPRAPQVPGDARETKTPRIIGVVGLVHGRYRLIDGYHRYRWSREVADTLSGQYIILS